MMREKDLLKKRRITTDDAIKALLKQGIEITEQEAAFIIDFLYLLAAIAVKQYLDEAKKDK